MLNVGIYTYFIDKVKMVIMVMGVVGVGGIENG